MEFKNLDPDFFLIKEEKIALETQQGQKNIKSLLLIIYKTNKELNNYNKQILNQQKERNLIYQQEKNFHKKQLKKEINIQQLVFEISNLHEEIKVFKQENQRLRNLFQLGQDNLEIRIFIQEWELQAYWNIQTEYRQETTRSEKSRMMRSVADKTTYFKRFPDWHC